MMRNVFIKSDRITKQAMPTFKPASGVVVQRRCASGDMGAACNDSTYRHDSVELSTRRAPLGHDFSRVGVFSGNRTAPLVQDQTPTQSAGLGNQFMAPDNDPAAPTTGSAQDMNAGDAAYHAPVIDSVELVTTSSGAVGGFDAIECDASLNQPGPYNDIWAKGSIANVHQVQFHMSQGSPTDVRAKRVVNRTSSGQGQQQPPKTGDDGPPPHEYQFTKDKLVIGDAPGYCKTLKDSDFPVTYKADFGCYAFDPLDNRIMASIAYHVEISKTYYGQIDPVNTVTVTDKKIGPAGVASPVKPKPPAQAPPSQGT